MVELKRILIRRLENHGIESHWMPGFIRSLANSFSYEPHPNLAQVNERLTYMGWDGYELDYHTFELIRTCFEDEGLKQTAYIPSKWFVKTFMSLEEDPMVANTA
jgi:hypothetical protein